MACRIEKLICESVASLEEGASVQRAAELMAERGVGALVVTRSAHVVGLFTERDLLMRVVGPGYEPKRVKLGAVCSRDLISIAHDGSCHEAIRKMHSYRCRRLLVYDDNEFLGLVRLPDVAKAMAEGRSLNNLVLNAFAAVTLMVACGVIAMMVYRLPEMLELIARL